MVAYSAAEVWQAVCGRLPADTRPNVATTFLSLTADMGDSRHPLALEPI